MSLPGQNFDIFESGIDAAQVLHADVVVYASGNFKFDRPIIKVLYVVLRNRGDRREVLGPLLRRTAGSYIDMPSVSADVRAENIGFRLSIYYRTYDLLIAGRHT